MRYAKRKTPIALYVGDRDEYFSTASVKNTERVLKSAGFPATLNMLEGRRHSYMDVPDDFHATVWSFLKANALTDLPKFAPYRLTSPIGP
jgi:alpha-beta hydrolase superfamily lysophospholipase